MSCFRGQMNEYTSIAIDRFDGRNLQCTVFFLSHCHKDHMIGLNNPQLLHHLRSKENIFIYVTEITRLLLLSEEMYQPLEEYIRILDIGVSQPVRVPSNNILKADYCVNVTPIPAGHCPGSVMFLFEGCEGTSLYTGDFRWEINQVSKIAAFRNEDGSNKKIKSLYVDTTFCIPEAYQIPSRASCVEATATLVSDWLHQSSLHVVSIFCPARYGHEHLLMELANRLDTKVHVPDWKAKMYDQIPDLHGIFTSNPAEARIHSCSTGMGHPSSQHLPCRQISPCGGSFRLLNIRPSTMWFTSEKSRSRTEDLIVTPASNKGLHRVCYSMHSSYSEIRDLVSYLQPECVLPNVLPASDGNMEIVKRRLIGFLAYPHKSRMKEQLENTGVKPLGILKKRRNNAVLVSGSGSSDELVFSSQEESPKKPASVCASKVTEKDRHKSPQDSYKRSESGIINDGSETLLSDHLSKSESSYNGSANNDEELDLFDDEEKPGTSTSMKMLNETTANGYNQSPENAEESFRLYVSGDSDVSDDDKETDVNEFEDYAPLKKNVDNTVELENKGNPPQIKSIFVNVEVDKYVDKLSPDCDKSSLHLEATDFSSVSNHNSGDTYNQAKAESSVEFLVGSMETKCYHVSKDEIAETTGSQGDEDDDDVIPNSQGTPTKTTPLYCKGRPRLIRAPEKQEKSNGVNSLWDGCLDSSKENTSSENPRGLVSDNLTLICPSPVNSHEKEEGPECDADSIGKEDVVVISSLEDIHSSQSSESQTFWDRSCGEFSSSHALNTTVKTSSVEKKSKAKLVVLKSAICDNNKEVISSDDEESVSKQSKVCMGKQKVSSANSINRTISSSAKADPQLTSLEQVLKRDCSSSMDHQLSLRRKFNSATQPIVSYKRTYQGSCSREELKSDLKKRKQMQCSTSEDDTQCVIIDVDLSDDKAVELKEENILSQSQITTQTKSSSSLIVTPSDSTKLKCKINGSDIESKSSFLIAKKRFCQSQTTNLSNMKQQNSTASGHSSYSLSQRPKKRIGGELTSTDSFGNISGKAKTTPVPEYLDLTQLEQKVVLDLTGDSSP